jgi:hypothetical protein
VSSNRRLGLASILLLAIGLLLMIVPPLARDGICGITGCADQVPDIAVARTAASEFAVIVPKEVAPSVDSVRLLQGGNAGSREWVVNRTGDGVVDVFSAGATPAGFTTVVPLTIPIDEGNWVAEVSFGCTTASLPFSPSSLSVGQIRSWQGVTDGSTFGDQARATEQCATEAGSLERLLLGAGALLATVGAILGIVVVLRREPRDPEDPGDWARTADSVAGAGAVSADQSAATGNGE